MLEADFLSLASSNYIATLFLFCISIFTLSAIGCDALAAHTAFASRTRVMPGGLYTESIAGTSNTSRPARGVDHELEPRRAKIGTEQCRLCGQAGCIVNPVSI